MNSVESTRLGIRCCSTGNRIWLGLRPVTIGAALLALLAMIMASEQARAVTYYWDTNGSTAGFGTASGTWGTDAFWSTSNTGVLTPAVTTVAAADALNFGNGATGLGAGTISVNGTQTSGNLTFAVGSGAIELSGGTINLPAVATITVNNAADKISSAVTGAATSLAKVGAGTLTLDGNVSVGTLIMNQGTLAGSGTLTAGALTLRPTGTTTISKDLSVAGSANDTVGGGGGTVILTGTNSINTNTGDNQFMNLGLGTLVINGGSTTFGNAANTAGIAGGGFKAVILAGYHHQGNITVQSGTFNILTTVNAINFGSTDGNGGGGLLRQSGGIVNIQGSILSRTSPSGNPAAGIIISGGTSTTFQNIAGAGIYLDISGGSVSNTGTFTGAFSAVSVAGGTFSAASYNPTGVGTSGTLVRGGQLTVTSGNGTLNDATGVFLSGGAVSASAISTPVLALNGGTIKAGTGATNLISNVAGAKIYTGGVTIDTTGGDATISTQLLGTTGFGLTGIGVNTAGSGYNIAKPAVTLVGGTGTAATTYVNFTTTGNLASISIGSPGEYTVAPTSATVTGGATLNNPTSAANSLGGLTKAGSGTLTLSNTANSYTGNTTVNAGTLKSGASNVLPNSSAVVVSGTGAGVTATLDLNGNSDTVASLALGGSTATSAAAVKTGVGTLTLGGDVTYSATNNPLGATISGNLSLAGAIRTFTVGNSSSTTNEVDLSAVVSNGALSKEGAGTLTLSGSAANTYAGLTSVNNGELDLNKTSGISAIVGDGNTATPDVTVAGGTLKWLANNQVANTANIGMTSGAVSLNGMTETINNFSNSGGTFTTGAGHLIGTGASITWSGGSTNTINDGGLVEDAHLVISGGTNTVEGGATGGVLQLNSGGAGLEMTGATLTLNSDNTVAGKLLLKGDVTTLASGTTSQILSGLANANSGAVDLDAATRTFTVADGGATDDLLISAQIGNGGVTKAGAGQMALSGVNTYAGNTTVTAGTLALDSITNNNIAASPVIRVNSNAVLDTTGLLGAADLILASGQTLTGSGTVNGAVTVANGAIISPGDSPGTLATGNEAWNGGGNYTFEINDVAAGAGNDPGWDFLDIDGTLDLTGASAGNKFNILLTSLSLTDVAGLPVYNFIDTASYSWLIAEATSPISSFASSSQFNVNTTAFANPYTGSFSVVKGTSVSGGLDTQLYLVYSPLVVPSATPEPGTLVLSMLGIVTLFTVAATRRARNKR